MITLITSLIGTFWPYLIGGAAILATLFGVRQSGKRAGVKKERAKIRKVKAATERKITDALDKDNSGKLGRERLRSRRGK